MKWSRFLIFAAALDWTLPASGVAVARQAEGARPNGAFGAVDKAAAAEAEQREAARKAAVIDCLVISLDREFILSEEQRQKLIRRLEDNWDDAWCVCFYQPVFRSSTVFPLPNPCVVPVLTKRQVEVWEGLEKPRLMYDGFQFGFFGANGDDLPLDEDFPVRDETKPDPTK